MSLRIAELELGCCSRIHLMSVRIVLYIYKSFSRLEPTFLCSLRAIVSLNDYNRDRVTE